MTSKSPTLLIFAGANGSGKTTAAKYVLPRHRIKEFVNADEIARGLSPFNPVEHRVAAGKLVISRINSLIRKSKSFALETTLSGKTLSRLIQKARTKGFKIEMHYLLTTDINLNIARIKTRVEQGGHHIPRKDVIRRYWRSLYMLDTLYADLCNCVTIEKSGAGNLVPICSKLEINNPFHIFNVDEWEHLVDLIEKAHDKTQG